MPDGKLNGAQTQAEDQWGSAPRAQAANLSNPRILGMQ